MRQRVTRSRNECHAPAAGFRFRAVLRAGTIDSASPLARRLDVQPRDSAYTPAIRHPLHRDGVVGHERNDFGRPEPRNLGDPIVGRTGVGVGPPVRVPDGAGVVEGVRLPASHTAGVAVDVGHGTPPGDGFEGAETGSISNSVAHARVSAFPATQRTPSVEQRIRARGTARPSANRANSMSGNPRTCRPLPAPPGTRGNPAGFSSHRLRALSGLGNCCKVAKIPHLLRSRRSTCGRSPKLTMTRARSRTTGATGDARGLRSFRV